MVWEITGRYSLSEGKFKILFSDYHHDFFEFWNQSAFEIIRKIISVAKVGFLRQEKRYG